MKTLRYRRAWLATFAVALQQGCGGGDGSQSSIQSVGGTTPMLCRPGDTRECVGPDTCPGGQQCDIHGTWGICDCGPTSVITSTQAGATSAGGQSSEDTSSTGGFSTIYGSAGGAATGGATTGSGSSITGGNGSSTGGISGIASTSSHLTGGFGGGVGGQLTGGWGGAADGLGGTIAAGGTTIGGKSSGGTASGGYAAGGSTLTGGAPNHPPQITSLKLSPNPVTKSNSLTVYVEATDLENDRISYSYSWMSNGNVVGYNSSVLSSYYLWRSDSITVTVTPSDSKSTGTPVTSEPVIVSNAAPRFNSRPTQSPTPYAGDDEPIQCSASVTDPDGDTLEVTYNWYKGGTLTGYHDATIPGSATTLGEVWSCEVVASDGTAETNYFTYAATTIASTVSGMYRSDVTWVAANSPYVLTGRVQVGKGATLKLEPGVTILGEGNSLELWGSLEAIGTAEKPIIIESLYISDYSATDKPGKVTLAFAEYSGGSLMGSSGSALVNVTDCVLVNLESPIYLPAGSSAHVFERNLFNGTMGMVAGGPLVLDSNTFANTSHGYTLVELTDTLDAKANNFMSLGSQTVIRAGSKPVNASNCYWGGVLDTGVPDLIIDNNDDLTISAEVTYLPTLAESSPTAPSVTKTYYP